MKKLPILACVLALSTQPALLRADGPADNRVDSVRRVPPAGVAIPDDKRVALTADVAALMAEIEAAKPKLGKESLALLPDVLIFHKAVDWALRYDEFFNPKQTDTAVKLLATARERLAALKEGKAPWLEQKGAVARGYQSKIDGSIQPYGVVVPEAWAKDAPKPWRLDFWFHGRGETLSELDFLSQRMNSKGDFTPADGLVLHTYGRYCNGQRFAGETDAFEALAATKKNYAVDENRIVVRGFSLGGAACWHMAMNHASKWCAAAPGAGFSETEQFLNFFQGETVQPAAWERKLWGLYDSTGHALNLKMVPTVAYSGEIDKQRQAAEAMVTAAKAEGIELTHIIGPKTAHAYEPGAKAEVIKRIDEIVAKGRNPLPAEVHFVTHSLKYNEQGWIKLDALEEHWLPARVDATREGGVKVTTKNVAAFILTLPDAPEALEIDGQKIAGNKAKAFVKEGGQWRAGSPAAGVRKQHNLQGPIDDAFMDTFIFVRPTGVALHPKVGEWVQAEMKRAVTQWRQQFRGDVVIKDDTALTQADYKNANLVLWGDPASNRVLATVAPRLPIAWSGVDIQTGVDPFDSAHHALICIAPNPFNPSKYVVVNSGFTFREYDYLNNARQTPKLPDWAVIDVNSPPNSRYPGAIVAADFFDEKWQLKGKK